MLNVKILIKKYKGRILIWGISLMATIWASSLLTPLVVGFNQYLVDTFGAPVSSLVVLFAFVLFYKIPVYSILLFSIIIWLIYKLLNKIILSRRELKIIKAEYGSGSTFVDITNRLNDLVVDNKLKIPLSNGIPGLDPTPGVVKIGKIKYQFSNKIIEKKFRENDIIDLP